MELKKLINSLTYECELKRLKNTKSFNYIIFLVRDELCYAKFTNKTSVDTSKDFPNFKQYFFSIEEAREAITEEK